MTERRPDPQITLDLLARHMWIADQLERGQDGVDAASAWDEDDLLTDRYEEFEAMAFDAVTAETKRRREEAEAAWPGAGADERDYSPETP